MEQRKIKEKAQKEFDRVDDPDQLWTIEAHGRRQEEANKARKANEEVKNMLDFQKSEIERMRV